jgi:hypothetical protein
MKYASALLTATIIIIVGLILRFSIESVKEERTYIGVQGCRSCHAVAARGNQYEVWQRSKHAAAYTALGSDKAKKYAAEHGIQNPQADERCLRCHTTAYGKDAERFQSSFRKEDGVQCEECHGAGSAYAKFDICRDKGAFIVHGGIFGNESGCYKCHQPDVKNSKADKCPFQITNFNFTTAFEEIKHPVAK